MVAACWDPEGISVSTLARGNLRTFVGFYPVFTGSELSPGLFKFRDVDLRTPGIMAIDSAVNDRDRPARVVVACALTDEAGIHERQPHSIGCRRLWRIRAVRAPALYSGAGHNARRPGRHTSARGDGR